jgi:polyhydroxyalkanoate synthesis regulator phasin
MSDSNEDDTIKQIVLKMNKKYDTMSFKLIDLGEIKKSVEFLSAKYDEIIQQNEDQKRLVSNLSKKVDDLTSQVKNRDKKISELTDRVNELEQQLDSNLEICGLPTMPDENTTEIVNKIAQICKVDDSSIVGVHRVPSRRTDRPPPIVLQFSSCAAKNEWIKRKEGRKLVVADILENDDRKHVYMFVVVGCKSGPDGLNHAT